MFQQWGKDKKESGLKRSVSKGELLANKFGTRHRPACHLKAGQTVDIVRWMAHSNYGLAKIKGRFYESKTFIIAATMLANLWNSFQER
eukprot:6456574-Amphidinium_carterae.1